MTSGSKVGCLTVPLECGHSRGCQAGTRFEQGV